jgi:hypothetical protein
MRAHSQERDLEFQASNRGRFVRLAGSVRELNSSPSCHCSRPRSSVVLKNDDSDTVPTQKLLEERGVSICAAA